MAAAEGDDADVFGYHYENGMLAVNLFHMRGGKMVDRREFFWEDLPEFGIDRRSLHHRPCRDAPRLHPGEPSSPAHSRHDDTLSIVILSKRRVHSFRRAVRTRPTECNADDSTFHPGEFFSALLKQLYIGQPYVPRNLYVPVDFEDREELEDLLSEQVADEERHAPHACTFSCRSAATNARSSISPETMPSSPTTSASACSSPTRKKFRKSCRTCSACRNCRSASSASTSRTFRARKPLRRWWCGKTAR